MPGERIEGAAIRTPRTPIEALSAATRTDIARIGRCADGTVEPLPHRSEFAVLGFFEPRHQAAKTRSCACGQCVLQMATRFAPEVGNERGLGERQVAFARRRVLRRELLKGLDQGERGLAIVNRAINPGEVGMG